MAKSIAVDEWLEILDKEYLSNFISAGGAAVKFVLTDDCARPQLIEAVECCCDRLGYVLLELQAENGRVHMPQEIFFQIAGQVDWRCLARRMVLKLAKERNYRIDGISLDRASNVFEDIADRNDLESQTVLQEVRPLVEERVSKNPGMLRDFRAAMRHLCLNEVSDVHPLLNWLTGARVSSVREFSIYTRIDRTTARHFVESMLAWIRLVGYCGTVLLIDNSRLAVKRNPRDGLRYYTSAMAVDHFELLREFVDGIDRLAGTLILVTPDNEFMEPSRGSTTRNVDIHPALQARLMDDVRDKNLANPVASLVRLHGSDQLDNA